MTSESSESSSQDTQPTSRSDEPNRRWRGALWALALVIAAAFGAYAMSSTTAVNASSDSQSSEANGSAKAAPRHKDLPGSTTNAKDIDPAAGVADQQVGVVGSGKENLYVPDSRSVPKVAEPGKVLYEQSCSSCHGVNGEGGKGVPSLHGVGAAAVDFYVGTGRMPVENIVVQAPRRVPIFSQEQIDALGDYISTNFGGGPAVPQVDLEGADLSRGMQLYGNNCAQCHNSAGSGGSLGRGYTAPMVFDATPAEVATAIRTGPGAMPMFNETTFDQQQLNDLVAYVDHLGEESPGGVLSLGSTGPVPEGFFAWFVGLGAMLLFARWIGTRV